MLEKADPAERTPSDDESAWLLRNRRQEEKLRRALGVLKGEGAENILETLQRLKQEHAPRRDWVWAHFGQSPLAMAIPHLLLMAAAAKQTLEIVKTEEDREVARVALTAAIGPR